MTFANFDRDELIEKCAKIRVDAMCIEEMETILIDQIIQSFDFDTDEQLIIYVKEFHPELLK